MGMFDYVNCKYPLPKPSFDLESWGVKLDNIEYQTKDLENCLTRYTIRDNGELWYEDVAYEWVDDDNAFLKGYMDVVSSHDKPSNFHGVLTFYCYEDLGERDGKFYSLELDYEAKFVDNKITDLKLVKELISDVTERKKKLDEWFEEEKIKSNKWYNKYFFNTKPVRKIRKTIISLAYEWYNFNYSIYSFFIRHL